MAADELSVRLSTRDELTGKLKDVRAEIKRTVTDLGHLNKDLDTPQGKKSYDAARESLHQLSLEEKRMRSEMGKNERAIKDFGNAGKTAAAKVEAGQERVRRSFIKSRAGAVAFGSGMTIALQKAFSGAKSVVSGFDDVGKSTAKLQRLMGGTAEDSSRLSHAFTMTGIDSTKAATSIGRFSRNIAAGSKDFKAMGIALKDSSGKALSSQQVLMNTADAFAKMPDGANKTAAAMKLFGKSGADMLPILNKGSKGMAEMFKESDSLGTTLSGKDLEAVKANTKAKRLWGESMKGVQIALGRELYPVLTSGAKFLSSTFVPALKNVIKFVKDNGRAVATLAVGVVAGVVAVKAINAATTAWTAATKVAAVAQRVWTGIQWAFNAAMSANPVALIVIAIVALIAIFVLAYKRVGWFRNAVNAAWGWIKRTTASFVDWFKSTAWPAIKVVIGYIVGYYKTLWKGVKVVWAGIRAAVAVYVAYFRNVALPAIKFVIGLVKGYFTAVWSVAKSAWGKVSGAVRTAVSDIKGIVNGLKGAFSGIWNGIADAAKGAFQGVKNAWNSTVGSFSVTIPDWIPGLGGKTWSMPRMQHGGITYPGMQALVGEVGPELWVSRSGRAQIIGADGPEVRTFAQAGMVIPNDMMPAAPMVVERQRELVGAGVGGPSVQIGTINAATGVDVEARVLHAMLRADRISRERR